MKLISCVPFHVLAIPGIRAPSGMTIKPGEGSWLHWSLATRGPSVFLISPPGWRPGMPPEGDARQVFEIPRSHCHLQWEFDALDGFEGVVKWDAPPVPPPVAKLKQSLAKMDAEIQAGVKALDRIDATAQALAKEHPDDSPAALSLRATPLQEPAVEGANPAAQASPVPPAGEGLTSQPFNAPPTVRRFERKGGR